MASWRWRNLTSSTIPVNTCFGDNYCVKAARSYAECQPREVAGLASPGLTLQFYYKTYIDPFIVIDYFCKFTEDTKCAKPGSIIFQQSIASFMAKLRLTL